MIKPCRKCGLKAEHYDSIPTCCKECWKERVRNNRAEKADYYRAYDRERSKLPYRKKVFIDKQRRKRNDMGRTYTAAHNKVARSVKAGRLIPPARCQRCGAKGPQAHHDDYAKPLSIMWLCPICHAARHKELGRLTGVKK